MNRRKFLNLISCGCCGYFLNSCGTVPITERRQLKLIPESKLNAQAAQLYEKIKEKEKLSEDLKSLNLIKEIGKKWKIQYHYILIKKIYQIQQLIFNGNTY